jgi:hypothetical protein
MRYLQSHYDEGSGSATMKLEIFASQSASQVGFVDFWAKQYRYGLERLYNDNIGKPLNEARIWNLFKWKNGNEKIAENKKTSIRKVYLAELHNLPSLTSAEDGKMYLRKLKGGAIWNIFWLHCLNHAIFPIFDQHTYRAMALILSLKPSELPVDNKTKTTIYFDQYIPFLRKFDAIDEKKWKTLDEALFAYGRFLKKGLSGK